MSKDFAMLNTARRLENYLSREYYGLNKMAENERIPNSLFEKKVSHYNELVDTLNDFFGVLSESPTSQLFTRYGLGEVDEANGLSDVDSHTPDIAVELPHYDNTSVLSESSESDDVSDKAPVEVLTKKQPEKQVSHIEKAHDSADVNNSDEPEAKEDEQEPEARWSAEGYDSHEKWLADKDAENAESGDDLAIGVNVSLSQHRAGQALSEYESSSEQDIASYDPEDDIPANVMPSETSNQADENSESDGMTESDESDERPTENLDYLNHTVDNVRVDNDPTQIATVETAVEREGDGSRRGVDIDVSNYMYQSNTPVIDDLISDDIMNLRVSRDEPDEPIELEESDELDNSDEPDNPNESDGSQEDSQDDSDDQDD